MTPAPRARSTTRKIAQKTTSNDDVVTSGNGTEHLETLMGYNASRAAQTLVSHFIRGVGNTFALRTVDFSVLSVIGHRPGITSRQLCQQLNVLPPNMVVLLRELDKRGWIERQPHPTDGRAVGLLLSSSGKALMKKAESAASAADSEGVARLSLTERKTLTRLLQKIYNAD